MKNILIPTDFTKLADSAFDFAETLADSMEVQIHILNVVNVPGSALLDEKGNLLDSNDFDVSFLKQDLLKAERSLTAWMSGKPDGVIIKVQFGHLINDILGYIKKNNIDLVVMGTDGAHGWKEIFGGSTAENILRQSPVPVISIHKEVVKIKEILFASDFNEPHSEEHFWIIKRLIKSFKPRLHLLRVVTKKHFQSSEKILNRMELFKQTHQLEKAESHLKCAESIEEGITIFCDNHDIDFIFMGTHGHKGLKHLIKGSISENIVNHLNKPVLTYKI